MVATRDRWSELGLLIQSLRTQTHRAWDIIIADESSNPITNCAPVAMILNRIQQEGHRVKILMNNLQGGVCAARNLLIEQNDYDNPLCARLDDDVVIEQDYLEKLVRAINLGYDLVSGVTPHFAYPEWERQSKFVEPIINDIELDAKGNIIKYTDDCGYSYSCDEIENILPATNFRSNAIYKTELHTKYGIRYESNLTKVGFREEAFFSMRAILAGYKIGVVLNAKAFHFQTPSGGCRFDNYGQMVQQDEQTWRNFIKDMFIEHGDFIAEYKRRLQNAN